MSPAVVPMTNLSIMTKKNLKKSKVAKASKKVQANIKKARKKRSKASYKNVGRKMFDGKSEEKVVTQLESAFTIGCTDMEACAYADISKQALYRYEEKHIEFRERKHILKENPAMIARKTIVANLDSNVDTAFKYLERKKKAEFAPHSTMIVDESKGHLESDRKKEVAESVRNWEEDVRK